ncbi:MAG: penicillin-binding protein 1A [Alphaproteobacteria bacterium]
MADLRKDRKDQPRSGRGAPSSGRPQKPVRVRRRSWPGRFVRFGLGLLFWGGIALAALVVYFAYDMPESSRLAAVDRRPSITILGADGRVLMSYGDLYGEPVELRQLPDFLPKAVLATEDRRFYEHGGLDPVGILRAFVANVRAGKVVQGGSTISQQLAKNLFLNPDRTMRRKVQETLLALWLEQRYNKDQILTIYLNRVYFGAGTYGVEAAAQRYFGKPARSLSLYESAMLAGLLKAPSRFSPARDGDLASRRAEQVLANMVDAEFITGRQAESAKAAKTKFAMALSGQGGRYFGDWIIDQVTNFIGYPDRDLVVVTTLMPRLQKQAEAKLEAILASQGANAGVSQAALVSMAPDGAIRAMVGGRDYGESQFNRATQALRQPGSSFKAFVYLAGLEAGLEPNETLVDAPITVEGWSPRNFDNRYRGDVTTREAVAQSLNSVAVRVAERAGRDNVIRVARRLGITADLRPSPSLALGTSEVTLLEMTQAYAAFANGGEGVWAYGIQEIRDTSGQVLYRRSGNGPGRVIAPDTLENMQELLTAVVTDGTGRGATIGRPAAGKTGTSQDHRDAWFIGFTAELVTGVWLGNDDGTPMRAITGGQLPARIWHDYMMAALEGIPPQPLRAAAPLAEPSESSTHERGTQGANAGSGRQSASSSPFNILLGRSPPELPEKALNR